MEFKEKLYKGYDNNFLEEISVIPDGDKIKGCIQCGTCSSSCPTSAFMDNAPRKLIAMIRAGMREEVLTSNSMWYCVSCYNCYVRCPKKIKITDIMYALKSISQRDKKVNSKFNTPKLASSFVNCIKSRGRINEISLLISYYLKSDWIAALKSLPLGIKLQLKGRLPLNSGKIKNSNQFRKIIKKVENSGGN